MTAVVIPCPGSKSMTQRALVIAALADGPSRIRGALDCDDSRHLAKVLQSCGPRITWTREGIEVEPEPLHVPVGPLDCANGGDTFRFASCLSLLISGSMLLDGSPRMRNRPVGALVEGLRQLGVCARYLGTPLFPPIELQHEMSASVTETPAVRLDLSLSSQHASGLMLVAPRLERGIRLSWDDAAVSRPYLDMTAAMIRHAGGRVDWQGKNGVEVSSTGYRATIFEIEPDWSAAAFLIAAARLLEIEVTIPGLLDHTMSLQGDSVFLEYLQELDRPFARLFNLAESPDLIGPISALALFASKPTALRGVRHVRTKESDRIRVLQSELSKLGARIVEHEDGIDLHPLKRLPQHPVRLEPSRDHRMAMTFGLIALRCPTIEVADPSCVTNSFPTFWSDLDVLKAAKGSHE